jgi:hypothetical protein
LFKVFYTEILISIFFIYLLPCHYFSTRYFFQPRKVVHILCPLFWTSLSTMFSVLLLPFYHAAHKLNRIILLDRWGIWWSSILSFFLSWGTTMFTSKCARARVRVCVCVCVSVSVCVCVCTPASLCLFLLLHNNILISGWVFIKVGMNVNGHPTLHVLISRHQ